MSTTTTTTAVTIDPITFEVIRHGFRAICNEMAMVVGQTAYSTAVNEGRDFAGTLYDGAGKLVSQGDFDLAGFVGVAQLSVPAVMDAIGVENMEPDDVYLTNDPYTASSHCNDFYMVKPIFHQGEIISFVASTAHWSDVGGTNAGSLNCRARTAFEEGVRVLPMAIQRRGKMNDDVVKLLLANMRQSWERLGDMKAQIAALRAGEKRVLSLVAKHGVDVVKECMDEVQNYSERLIRGFLGQIPDGVYHAEDFVDQDPATGLPKRVAVELTIEGDHAVVDLTGSDDAALSGINCTLGASMSAVFIAFASILPPMPMNAGIRRAVELKMRQGSIVWAQPPSPVSGSVPTTMECLVGTVSHALSLAVPDWGVGSPYSILNMVIAGRDDRADFAESYLVYLWVLGGMGGVQTKDGASSVGSPFSSSIMIIPSELQERRYPLVWRRQHLLQDSGGPGRRRGGLGCEQVVEMTQPGTLSAVGNREIFAPPGVFGGHQSTKSELHLRDREARTEKISIMTAQRQLEIGDGMMIRTAGGGGYGDPCDREVDMVIDDVKDEYVSVEAARRDYGVVITAFDRRTLDVTVDLDATTATRAAMKAGRTEGQA